MPYFLLALALVFFACGRQSNGDKSAQEDHIVVYSPHGKEMLGDFAQRFEAVNPGVKVHWQDMGSQNVLDRIRSEKSNPQADIWWGAPSVLFMNAADEGLLQPYRPSWANEIEQAHRDVDDRWFGTYLTPEVIAFNSHALTRETAPQDWDELLLPKWKDKITIRYPIASGTMRTIFATLIWRSYKTTGTPEQGYEWLRKLDANTKSYPANPTLMYLQLARQEALVTLWNMPDIELQKALYPYPFDYIIPESGTPVLVEGLAIVANCKHPKLAREFYEFITTQDSFSVQAKNYFRIPTRKDIPASRLPEWIVQTEINAMEIDWNVFSEKSKEWMRYWDERIKGSGKS
jgi:iron(III) transport system substrate-binding protein